MAMIGPHTHTTKGATMISLPTTEQIALVATYVALSAPLMKTVVDGQETVMPEEVPLQLRKPEEQEVMEEMVTIACTLFYYAEDDEYEDFDDLMQATLKCWAEGTLE